jgi:hypothetical protein
MDIRRSQTTFFTSATTVLVAMAISPRTRTTLVAMVIKGLGNQF